MKAKKKRALLNLKKSHLEQIQQHLSDSNDRRSEEAVIRKEIMRDQDALDRRYQLREAARKQQTLAHNAVREKLAKSATFKVELLCLQLNSHDWLLSFSPSTF